ncbi:MAG: hypothetical protein A2X49_10090 [Lentisphaerae bacterium GWF2_52_8]|nr:MAG: hypothetical protein A2X49_10090 [Lentisphaerae bacterium GWF2_52_8]
MDLEFVLPRKAIRREVAYRTVGPGLSCAVPGCGFITKDRRNDITDNTPSDYVMVYVLRGEGSYIDWNGKEHQLRPGCVAQRLPGRKHSTVLVPDGKWYESFLVIGRPFFETLAGYGFVDMEKPVLRPGLRMGLFRQFEELLADIAGGTGQVSPRILLKAHSLLADVYAFDKAARAPEPHAKLVEEAREILGNDLMERISIPELAANFNLSYERFRKVFREQTGVSPGAYRLRRRIEKACQMLSGTELSVKETAYALGYADMHSFSKQFAHVMGVSPSRFRKGA